MYLDDELHHLGVNQTVDRFSVNVCDQVALSEPRLVGRAAVLHVLKDSEEEEDDNEEVFCCGVAPPAVSKKNCRLTQTMWWTV